MGTAAVTAGGGDWIAAVVNQPADITRFDHVLSLHTSLVADHLSDIDAFIAIAPDRWPGYRDDVPLMLAGLGNAVDMSHKLVEPSGGEPYLPLCGNVERRPVGAAVQAVVLAASSRRRVRA